MCDSSISIPGGLHYAFTCYTVHVFAYIEYKLILAALIDSEQMLLSIEAQLCTRRECKTFRPRRPSSVAMHKVRVLQCSTTFVLKCICLLMFIPTLAINLNLQDIFISHGVTQQRACALVTCMEVGKNPP